MSKSVLTIFSSKNIIVSGLKFRSLTHFKFLLCMVLRSVLISFFYMRLSSFSSTTFKRSCLFSIVYSCVLCPRKGAHRCVGLPLGFISFTLGLCFCAFTILLLVLRWKGPSGTVTLRMICWYFIWKPQCASSSLVWCHVCCTRKVIHGLGDCCIKGPGPERRVSVLSRRFYVPYGLAHERIKCVLHFKFWCWPISLTCC